MPSTATTSVLTRLRRHRGLWVLAVFVMLVKFASGTVCLTDRPDAKIAPMAARAAQVDAPIVDVGAPSSNDEGTCWLGEGSGCHCVCAHPMTLPSSMTIPALALVLQFPVPVFSSGWAPTATGSLLRPPIA